MEMKRLINKIRNNIDKLELGNSQSDVVCQYIEEYFSNTSKYNQKELDRFLINNFESFEMSNSQFELMLDILKEE